MIKILESCTISVSIQRGIWEVHSRSPLKRKVPQSSTLSCLHRFPVEYSGPGGEFDEPKIAWPDCSRSESVFPPNMGHLRAPKSGYSTPWTGIPAVRWIPEVGVELHKGLDQDAVEWAKAELPTTYHFLDINLDEAGIPFPPMDGANLSLIQTFGLRDVRCGFRQGPVNLAP